jgi:hypothetical protein
VSPHPCNIPGTCAIVIFIAPLWQILAAEESPRTFTESINLETHGFVSFGHLRTWNNNVYDDDTTDGTYEFYEAALNAVTRPFDRLRLGAQLFVRDLGHYDNGRVELDWGYLDYNAHEWCDVQLGRVKIPLGLYNESQDIDAARTSVFLAQSVYPTRLRELLVSVDGGKVAGRFDLADAGALSYTVFAGTKHFNEDSAYATYVGETARFAVDDVEVGPVFGGMLHWDTPLPDLALRLTMYQGQDIDIRGISTAGATSLVSDSRSMVASMQWAPPGWTLDAEYLHIDTDGESVRGAVATPYEFHYDGGYLSATWHVCPWFEGYLAAEYRHNDLRGRPTNSGWSWIAAVNLLPLRNWSLKAEYQYQDNTVAVLPVDNPQGIVEPWHLLALKTTVDF